ncbi:MAG: hypothetical protein KJ964_12065, partial [Verrucomicrobia bacterium]|nr:hypothetical protein [Verrucomicrobiota bacterium]MBU1734718.1 hypothetical protein [Verrucomicrobiota bacterium]
MKKTGITHPDYTNFTDAYGIVRNELENTMFCSIRAIRVGNVVSWVQKRVEKMEPREHRIRPVGESENTHWGDTGDARGL